VCLIGGDGSGKTEIATELAQLGRIKRLGDSDKRGWELEQTDDITGIKCTVPSCCPKKYFKKLSKDTFKSHISAKHGPKAHAVVYKTEEEVDAVVAELMKAAAAATAAAAAAAAAAAQESRVPVSGRKGAHPTHGAGSAHTAETAGRTDRRSYRTGVLGHHFCNDYANSDGGKRPGVGHPCHPSSLVRNLAAWLCASPFTIFFRVIQVVYMCN
jgi:hypothetical protein